MNPQSMDDKEEVKSNEIDDIEISLIEETSTENTISLNQDDSSKKSTYCDDPNKLFEYLDEILDPINNNTSSTKPTKNTNKSKYKRLDNSIDDDNDDEIKEYIFQDTEELTCITQQPTIITGMCSI